MAQARQVATSVKLTELLGQMELSQPSTPQQNPLLTPPADTTLKTTIPAKAVAPAKKKP